MRGNSKLNLVPMYIPPLVKVLRERERAKGCPLTELEVSSIVKNSTVVMLPPEKATEMELKRGFEDISPEAAWEQWLQRRETV